MMDSVLDRPPVEEYALATPPKAPEPPVDEHAATAGRLGLATVAAHTQALYHRHGVSQHLLASTDRVIEAAKFYPEWRGLTLKAWEYYMPTHYPQYRWSSYCFDVIPLRALKAIEAAADAALFDAIEIWTPERQRVRRRSVRQVVQEVLDDPVAVGIVFSTRHHHFPIVRWGAEELVSQRTVLRVGLWRAVFGGS